MFAFVSAVWAYVSSWVWPKHHLGMEVLALRHQIAILKNAWPGWRTALMIVQPETIIGWLRAGFWLFWRWKSR